MLESLLGGVLIGTGASLLLYGTGRIFGVSGILGGFLGAKANDRGWRLGAILGLLAAGFVLKFWHPDALPIVVSGSPQKYILSGLLVGFGTQLGSGCTSGHGICGISRLSPRSLTATLTFMMTGVATVYFLRVWGGFP